MSARRGAILSADKRERLARASAQITKERIYTLAPDAAAAAERFIEAAAILSLSLSLSLAKNGGRFERGDAPPALCAVS